MLGLQIPDRVSLPASMTANELLFQTRRLTHADRTKDNPAQSPLEFHYVRGLKTFGAFSSRELDSVSFVERFEA